MICEYKIKMTGVCGLVALSPEMVVWVIKKARDSDRRELAFSAEELFPRGYIEYLAYVLEVNGIFSQPSDRQEVYGLAARQLQALRFKQQICFEQIELRRSRFGTQFDILTNETFYLLLRKKAARLIYCYEGADGKEVELAV